MVLTPSPIFSVLKQGPSSLIALLLVFFITLSQPISLKAIAVDSVNAEEKKVEEKKFLLLDMKVQIEATQAVNDMYNFNFDYAEKQFRWLKQKYDWHPLPYFLLGLSQWWRMTPNIEEIRLDEKFMEYMDQALYYGHKLLDEDPENVEAAFFLAAAYGFQGRLLSDRRNWRKAAFAGKNALKYLEICKGRDDFSPELLFGDALYNYYSVWVPENYPILKPILALFPKGNKDLGIQQLRETSRFAFYTRTEAQYFLMRILAAEDKDPMPSLQVAMYLVESFPNNPVFHRYYARLLYGSGRYIQAEKESLKILEAIEEGKTGYEANSGRYASFFLGQINQQRGKNEEAKRYYKKALSYGEEIEAYETGYYIYALLNLGRIAEKEENKKESKEYFKLIKKHAKRSHPAHKQAREYLAGRK